MLIEIRTITTSPAAARRVVVFLMMTLLFGLQSVATSAAIANDISHAFSAIEHQDSQAGITTYHEGCSAKKSPAPVDLLDSAPLTGAYSTQPDLPDYQWVATLVIDCAMLDLPSATPLLPLSPAITAYTTPVYRQDILLI